MQRSKTYRAAAETFDKNEVYSPLTAIRIAKNASKKTTRRMVLGVTVVS